MSPIPVPVIPPLPAGHVVQLSDLQALSAAGAFLMQKPFTKILDNVGGQGVPQSSYTVVQFGFAQFDIDGMWGVGGANDRLTIQTPGWYKIRYGVTVSAPSNNGNVNTYSTYTTGPNNPAGSNSRSNPFYGGMSQDITYEMSAGAGVIPYYLYSGDYVQVWVGSGNLNTMSTSTSGLAGATNWGSYFSLEYVSSL